MRFFCWLLGTHFDEWLVDFPTNFTVKCTVCGKERDLSPIKYRSRPWQPIATAPKDGVDILVFNGVGIFLVYKGTPNSQYWSIDQTYDEPLSPEPTHWHSLPEIP